MDAINISWVLIIGVLVILGLLLIMGLVVVLAVRNKRSPQAQPAAPQPSVSSTPEERQAILKKLADGELTKAEAEEQLNQLGTPVPTAMPAPPPRSGAGKGCLIALIMALIIPLVLLALGFLFFVSENPSVAPPCIEKSVGTQNSTYSVETAYLSAAKEAVGYTEATFPSLRSGKRSLHQSTFPSLRSRKRSLHLVIDTSSPQVFTNSHGGKS